MQYESYHIEASNSFLRFEFWSEGPKGRILKRVELAPFKNTPNVFNLGFGDVYDTDIINDIIVTNNNDSMLVLATVALIINKFFELHPGSYVYAEGSTSSRTRLYRMNINKNLAEIEIKFEVFGLLKGNWEHYQKDKPYEAFLIRRKNSNFEIL